MFKVTEKFLHYVTSGVFVVIAILMVTFLVMALYPYEPIKIEKLMIDKQVVKQGEQLRFVLVAEKLIPIPVRVKLELSNSENIALLNYWANNPVGKLMRWRSTGIPSHTPLGKYRLHWTGTYEINPFNTVTKQAFSDEFEVTK